MTLYILLLEFWPSYTFLLLVTYHSLEKKPGPLFKGEKTAVPPQGKWEQNDTIGGGGGNIAIIPSKSIEIKNLEGWSEKGAEAVVSTRDDDISAHKLI